LGEEAQVVDDRIAALEHGGAGGKQSAAELPVAVRQVDVGSAFRAAEEVAPAIDQRTNLVAEPASLLVGLGGERGLVREIAEAGRRRGGAHEVVLRMKTERLSRKANRNGARKSTRDRGGESCLDSAAGAGVPSALSPTAPSQEAPAMDLRKYQLSAEDVCRA